MKIEIVHPRMLVIECHQEHGDPGYGTCLWMRCTLNLDAHTIAIQSDCGSYSTGSFCCRDFLEFCADLGREVDYLLGKVSRRTFIDPNATVENINDHLDDVFETGNPIWDKLEDAVNGADTERDIVEAVENLMDEEDVFVDEYDLYECIHYDYPPVARRAIQIFCENIVPVIAEEAKKEKDDAE